MSALATGRLTAKPRRAALVVHVVPRRDLPIDELGSSPDKRLSLCGAFVCFPGWDAERHGTHNEDGQPFANGSSNPVNANCGACLRKVVRS